MRDLRQRLLFCVCVFGCSLLWSLFVHLRFWVLSFMVAICAFALLGALFCGHYLCICSFGCSLLWPLPMCASMLLGALFYGHYLCICAFVCSLLWPLFMCASALLGALFGWVLSCYSFPFPTSIPCRLLL